MRGFPYMAVGSSAPESNTLVAAVKEDDRMFAHLEIAVFGGTEYNRYKIKFGEEKEKFTSFIDCKV